MGIFADVIRHSAASFAEVSVLMLVMRPPVRAQIVLLGLSSKRYAAMTEARRMKRRAVSVWLAVVRGDSYRLHRAHALGAAASRGSHLNGELQWRRVAAPAPRQERRHHLILREILLTA